MKCPLCNYESEQPMLHTYDKKNLVMMGDWSTHAKTHDLTENEFRNLVLTNDKK